MINRSGHHFRLDSKVIINQDLSLPLYNAPVANFSTATQPMTSTVMTSPKYNQNKLYQKTAHF
jgi:hypothetical protein